MLKNHADAFPGLPQLALAHGCNILTVHRHLAAGWPLQKIDAAHQGRLAGTAEADNAIYLAPVDMQADILDGSHGTGWTVIDFLNMG